MFLIKLLACVSCVAFAVYMYINSSNSVMELRLAIPQMQKEVRALHAENERLQYEIDQFESPLHLMELSRKPEFSHMKSSFLQDVIQIPTAEKKP